MAAKFQLVSDYAPAGDQPKAIEQLVAGFQDGKPFQVLLGATGTGKTFTASNVIAALGKPTLVLAHNKTLAAQLYKEFKGFFSHNAVQYFVSYYDYYQPEAYIPQRDIYIEKDSSINENIDRLRLAATSALVSREDVIIVASVSCIYGLGSPTDYKRMMVYVQKGEVIDRDNLLLRLVDIQYQRNDIAFERGKVRVRGDTIDIWPASEEVAYRMELFGDEVDALSVIHPVSGETIKTIDELYVYPAKHFVTPEDRVKDAIAGIEAELAARLEQFKTEGKLLEAERLKARCRYDLDMLREVGYCSGVENYARWFSGRAPGEAPYTLIDFFPEDFLVVVDESHVSLPQVRGMFHGDFSRKTTLVEHGFRLPSALDNRPLKFDEFEKKLKQCLCLSATPGPYELEKVGGEVTEQVIRPTGLVDPVIHIRPARGQVADLSKEIKLRADKSERTLVTTLTKRMAEDLSTYFRDAGMRCKWLHSELDAIERIATLRELREGQFDVLVGVNLLREGLDLPEVSLVAILDADKEGFLRSATSLIQTIGRAARNVNAEVILYADNVTNSMSKAIGETNRRRDVQLAYNKEHGITPQTVITAIKNSIEDEIESHKMAQEVASGSSAIAQDYVTIEYVQQLFQEMLDAAKVLDFERAQALRDQIVKLEAEMKKKYGEDAAPSVLGGKAIPVSQPEGKKRGRKRRTSPGG